MKQADSGLGDLASTVDTVIAIPNDRLLTLVPRGASFFESFRLADDVLRQAVQGISDIIVTPGLINRDFSDIRATMTGMGYAMLGTATAQGENAAIDAARQAINSPLLDDSRIKGSRGMLINITGSSRLGLHEVNEACSIIREAADCEDVQISFGVILNESLGDSVKITVIATGFQPENAPTAKRQQIVVESRPVVASPMPPPPPIEEPEPERMEYAAPEPSAPPPPVTHAAPARPLPPPQPNGFDSDDLDTPAYMRQGKLLN
jgi:cell division protein FtsZ